MERPVFPPLFRFARALFGVGACLAVLTGCEKIKEMAKDESPKAAPVSKVAPAIAAISNVTVAQDQAATVRATITDTDSTLDCQSSLSVTVSDYALFPSTYISTSGTAPNCTVTFQPAAEFWGSATAKITVTDGTYTASSSFTITVTEGAAVPTVSAASANEAAPVVFTVRLSHALPAAKSFTYATRDGTALAGTNYAATSGTLTFAAGETVKTISVSTTQDNVYTPNLGFFLDVNAGGVLKTAAGTIVNIDGAPTASAAAATAGEGAALTFTVNLTRASSSNTTVTYSTSDGTAVAGVNYTAVSGTLTFTPGQTSKTVTVNTLDDGVYVASVGMTLTMTANGVTRTATGSITDTQGPPTASASSVSANEGSNLVFTVNLSAVPSSTVTVSYVTSNGTAAAGTNYTAVSGTLTFLAGQTSKTVTVPSLTDGVHTADLTFSLLVTTDGTTNTATGTVTNTDAAPVASASGASANEGSSISFTVTLNRASSTATTVTYSTTNGTAMSGTNYTSSTGTLTFSAGQTSKTLTVPTLRDSVFTADLTFTLSLTTGATTNTATGTVVDVDSAPTASVASASADEGSDVVFTVTLSHASSSTTSVTYASANGTALAGTNYTAVSGTLSFLAGETSKTVTVNTAADSKYSPNLTFTLGATTAGVTHSATGTIVNTDAAPAVSAANVSANEGSNLSFAVTLDRAATVPVTVTYATSDVTARAGVNYTSASGTLTFAAGQTTKTLNITSLTDSTYNADLTFTLALTTNSVMFPATGTVVNTDTVPSVTLSAAASSVVEGNPASFTFTLNHASAYNVQVNYATTNGTASSSDYGAGSGTVTVTAGTLSSTILVATSDDNVDETDETFSMGIASVVNATLGATTSVTETIQDTALLYDFTAGSLPSGLTFSRASAATYHDSSGILQTAASGTARFDHDPSGCSGACAVRGLLVEEARTNLLLQSSTYNTTWTNGSCTLTAAAATSPSGAADAYSLLATGAATNADNVSQSVTLAASTAYTLSFYVKNSNALASTYQVSAFSSGTTGKTVTLTWAGGVPTASAGTVRALPNGWYRVSHTFTTDAADTGAATVSFFPSPTLMNGTVFVWGAQLEAGASPTCYIATTTATVTRAADGLSIDNFSGWFNATAWTAILDVSRPAYEASTSAATPDLFSSCDDTSTGACDSDSFEATYLPSDNTFRGRSTVSSSIVATSNHTNAANLTDVKVQMGVTQSSAGALQTFVNGTAATASAGAAKPNLRNFVLGSGGRAGAYTRQLNGHLKKFTYRARPLSSSQVQALTSD